MTNKIQSVAIDRFVPHPDNPNRMSKANFAKLVRNIERTGRYEPLVARPCPDRPGYFQIINGHHRWQVLAQLGHKAADAVIWNVDDEQTDILLATLNRLAGFDVLEKKLALLRRLSERMRTKELAKLLPQTAKQMEHLTNLKMPAAPVDAKPFATPMVFFLTAEQLPIVEDALFLAELNLRERHDQSRDRKAAATKAAGLTELARFFLERGPNKFDSRSTAK